ncbi:MAG: hypothetical protein K6F37_00760 [Lachnospiraceae bacterium]|nr:hypothetical protein [Lachnospiraceae bacterium]
MNTAKKYSIVALFGLMAIVCANTASISDYLSGIVLGAGIMLTLYGLYKMVSVVAAAKKQEASQDDK